VVTEVLECGAVKPVAARFGDDADLATRACAVLRWVTVRINAELLHILQRGLQAEGRCDLAVQIARGGVNDGGAFDAVVTDGVLLRSAPGKPDIAERARTTVERAGRLQIKLRDLAAIERQPFDFGFVDVRAHTGG